MRNKIQKTKIELSFFEKKIIYRLCFISIIMIYIALVLKSGTSLFNINNQSFYSWTISLRSLNLIDILYYLSLIIEPSFVFIFCFFIISIWTIKRCESARSIILMSVVLASSVLSIVLNELFQSPRPLLTNMVCGIKLDYSFPPSNLVIFSSMIAVLSFYIAKLLDRKLSKYAIWIVASTIITISGFSLLYLGQIWLSDFIMSVSISTLTIAIIIFLDKYAKRRKRLK